MYAKTLLDGLSDTSLTPISPSRPLIIDSFAGGGGASTGIERALGRSPDYAINHNAEALALHAANHPETIHLSENVYRIDPLDYLRGKHIGLAWFSPDCKHFSKAKGGKPVSRNIRDLCWIIPGWIERIQKSGGKVDVVIMENVEEFKDYGPLIKTPKGEMPDPERKGETFQKWCKAIRRLGGKIHHRELRACDYGAPTIRRRLFVIVRFDGLPIVWPEPTHAAPTDPDVIMGRKLPWRTAAEIIDWSLPCPSIFDTGDEILAKHGLRAVRPLADNTMARVARGMKRYVLDAGKPFLVSIAHGDSGGRREYPLDDPYGVVTAGGVTHGVIAPSLSAFYGPGAGGKDRSASAEEPVRVVTTENRHAVIAPHLMTMRNSGKPFNGADEPTHTITAGGAGLTVVVPSLVGCGGRAGQSRPRGGDEPTATVTAKADVCVATAFLAQHNGDLRKDGREEARPGRAASQPLATITSLGTQQQVVTAFLAQNNYMEPGHDARKPLSTIVARGCTQSVVAPYLQAYYGVDQNTPMTEPLHTATTKPRFGHIEAEISLPPFTEAQAARARQVAEFMRSHGLWDDREFVTVEIDGYTFVIVDIGMRMLSPRELYNAQGFPIDYKIDGYYDESRIGHNGGPVWVPFSKSVQVSCVGNSVCPPVAEALVAANCNHLVEERLAA